METPIAWNLEQNDNRCEYIISLRFSNLPSWIGLNVYSLLLESVGYLSFAWWARRRKRGIFTDWKLWARMIQIRSIETILAATYSLRRYGRQSSGISFLFCLDSIGLTLEKPRSPLEGHGHRRLTGMCQNKKYWISRKNYIQNFHHNLFLGFVLHSSTDRDCLGRIDSCFSDNGVGRHGTFPVSIQDL